MRSWHLVRRALPFLMVLAVLGTVRVAHDTGQAGLGSAAAGPKPAIVHEHDVPGARPSAVGVAPTPERRSGPTVVAELPKTSVRSFSVLGVTWNPDARSADLAVDVRWRHDGRWSSWTELDIELGSAAEGGRPGTEPQWTDASDGVAVRVTSSSGLHPSGLRVATIDPNQGASTRPVAATVDQPPIIMRSQWGASGGDSCFSPIYGATTLGAVIHHTAGSNSYTKSQSAGIVKATQAYHINSRGWCDIGYNFLVDKYGQIFEGRKGGITKPVRAAHSGNDAVNQETMGVSLMGTFSTASPTAAMKKSVADLVAWRFSDYGIPAKGTFRLGGLTLNRIAGHRDVVGTECPGATVYAWLSASGGLRDEVQGGVAYGFDLPVPANLRSTTRSNTSITLDWDDVAGAQMYRVQVSEDSSMSGASYHRFTGSDGTVDGLEPGTRYYYRVAVVDPDSGDKLSDYTQNPYPSVSTYELAIPSGLTTTARLAHSLTFDWDDVPGAQAFRIQISKSASMSGAAYVEFDGKSSGRVTGLDPSTSYHYRVAAIDPDSRAKVSDYTQAPYPDVTTTGTVAGGYDLPSPTGLRTTAQSANSLSLDWDDVPGGQVYRVQLATSSTMSRATYHTFGQSMGTINGLNPSTRYWYRVVVADPDDGSKLSDYTQKPYPNVSTPATTSIPGGYTLPIPTGLETTNTTARSLTFDWDDVPGAQAYRIQISKNASMSGADYAEFDGTSSGRVTGLDPSTRYYYRVAAIDPATRKKASDYTQQPYPSTFTAALASGGYVLPIPSGLHSTSQSDTSLSFDWDDVEGAQAYRIQISKNASMSASGYAEFDGNSQGTVAGLDPSTLYYFRVAAIDPQTRAKASDYTQQPYPTILTNATAGAGYTMPIPTGLTADDATSSSLDLDWNAVTGAETYRVQVSEHASMSEASYHSFPASDGTVTGLSPSTDYYFRVAVVDPDDGDKLSDYTQSPYPSEKTSAYDLSIPTGLVSNRQTTSSLSLDWDDVAGARAYRVQIATNSSMSGASYTEFDTSNGVVGSLSEGTQFWFRVAAIDPDTRAKASDYTQEPYPTVATARQGYDYGVPTGLTSTGHTTSSIQLDWNDVTGAQTYRVQLSKNASMSGASYHRFTASAGAISGLAAGTRYYFRVAMIDPDSGAKLSDYTQPPYPSVTTSGGSSAGNSVTVPSSRVVTFKGHGYGHGIGMGQYGAEGGAREGATYRQILSHYYPGTSMSSKSGNIRVLLSSDTTDSVMIEAKSGLTFRRLSGGSAISLPTTIGGKPVIRWSIDPLSSDKRKSALRYRTDSTWRLYNNTTWTGEAQFEGSTMDLVPPAGGDKTYRTALRSTLPTSGATNRDTVNVLSIEYYTRGVVPRESPASWHAEALKAQAVAARTYGVRSITSSRHYDICDTTSCQVYGGGDAEVSSTNAAVSATDGQILTYGGSPAFTQFSSSSGGYTNDGSQPYLKAVEDPWDDWSGNKNHDWSIAVKASTIESRYRSIGTLRSLQVTKRNGHGDMGGRVMTLKLVGSKGSTNVSGVTARFGFGLRSDWFGF